MKTKIKKSTTLLPTKPLLPLKTLVNKICDKGNLTQNDIERACDFHLNYLSRQLGHEKKGEQTSVHLVEKLERKYEFILTGKRTIEVGEEALMNKMANEITYLRAYVDVLMTEVAFLIDSNNGSGKKQELATTAREAAEVTLRAM